MRSYKKSYRIPSARLRNWDYGWNAHYFITICTKKSNHFFGKIVNGKMILSEIGKMAEKYWLEIPKHFPFVKLGVFVIMPNHIHGIIEIAKLDDGRESSSRESSEKMQNIASGRESSFEKTQNIASGRESSFEKTQNIASVRGSRNKFGPQSQNIPSIIRGFKIGVIKNARLINPNFGWQPRYYDIIIRDEIAYRKISNYIINNVKKWHKDRFHKGVS